MDFERIALLLSVFHSSLDVPNTDRIRAAIMDELRDINTQQLKLPLSEAKGPRA